MAIINCPECNNRVSDKAESCPKCAYPMKKAENKEGCFLQTLNMGCVIGLIIVMLIILITVWGGMIN